MENCSYNIQSVFSCRTASYLCKRNQPIALADLFINKRALVSVKLQIESTTYS